MSRAGFDPPPERPWHRDSITAHGNTSRGVRFKSKFHLMWRVPSQQEPSSTVSFLYIVHFVSVCAARGWGGLVIGTLSVSTSPCFCLFISFSFTYNFLVCFDVLTVGLQDIGKIKTDIAILEFFLCHIYFDVKKIQIFHKMTNWKE